jgi:3-hydroxyacyl-[acyl-carrier-protein] dehydratase
MSKSDGAWAAAEHRFAPDHPTASGHFPGNPIIPGALLLDHVLHVIGGALGPPPREFRMAKFLSPVRPGDALTTRWQRRDDGEVTFECRFSDTGDLALLGAVKPSGP